MAGAFVKHHVLAFALLTLAACAPASQPAAAEKAAAPAPATATLAATTPTEPAAHEHAEGAPGDCMMDDEAQATEPAPADPQAAHFGQPFAGDAVAVELSALVQDPTPFAGKLVETSGLVSQVCQNRGCWMELQAGEGGPRVRAPMAGHAFFLPRDSVGKHARVQGTVTLRPLSEAHKRHLEAEGAQATDSALSLVATAVALK